MKWLAVIGCAATAVTAHADEIPTVTIKDAGPDQTFPTGKSFYVAGEAGARTTGVQVAIVKKGNAALIGNNPPACSALYDQIQPDKANSELFDAGIKQVRKVFPAASPDYGEHDVLLSSRWDVHKTSDPANYKVLVSEEGAFFGPGFSYCVYVLKRTQQIDDTTLEAAIEKLEAYQVCAGQDDACRDRLVDMFTEHVRDLARKTLVTDDGRPPPSCPLPAQPTAPEWLQKYCSLKQHAYTAASTALTLFDARKAARDTIGQAAGFNIVGDWLDANSDLGLAIVTALVRFGALLPLEQAKARREQSSFVVGEVQLLDDGRIRVAESRTPGREKQWILKEVSTKDLLVGEGVTLHDLVAASRGNLHLDDSARGEPTSHDLIELIDRVGVAPLSTADQQQLAAVAKRAWLLSTVVEGPGCSAEPGTLRAVTCGVKAWFAAPARATALKRIANIAAQLQSLAVNKGDYDQQRKALTVTTGEVFTLGGPRTLPIHVEMDESAWLFAYVTPVIGYAQIASPDDWFSIPYIGAQVHWFPNPVNDPMWSHGLTDIKRAIALELGVATKASNFGPDNRYRGVFGLPVPVAAIAVHLIPYTSISAGAAFLERRQTVLATEDPQFRLSFYIGLSVHANVPDLLKKQATAITVDKK